MLGTERQPNSVPLGPCAVPCRSTLFSPVSANRLARRRRQRVVVSSAYYEEAVPAVRGLLGGGG